MVDVTEDEHHHRLIERIIHLHGIMVVEAHDILVVQPGAGTDEDSEGKGEVVGLASVSDAKHKNLLKSTAEVNAFTTYARNSGMALKGFIGADMGATDSEKAEFEHVYQAYEGLVEKEIKGELKPSFSVIRETSDNRLEMQVFFLVDEDAATKARIRAFENAAKESEVAQKYANKISDFIREGFNNK